MLTLIEKDHAEVDASIDETSVVVDSQGFTRATGWELKPEGMCRGTACVPVKGTGIVTETGVDVAAFAERLGQALVIDHERGLAALGGDPMSRGTGASLAEVELPALDGSHIDLGRFVGKKTLLIAWASW